MKNFETKLNELYMLLEKLNNVLQNIDKNKLKSLLEGCSKKKTKKKVTETDIVIEQLPKDIDKGSLHQVLGYSEDFNLQEQSEDEMIRRQKEQINKNKVTYKELIGKLNWQKVMNKTNNPQFSKKLDRIMKQLKQWWEDKNKE